MDEFLTPPEAVHAVAAERPNPATIARIGLLGIAAAALIAVAILAFGSGAAPAGTLAAGSNGTGSGGAVPDLNFGGGPAGPGGPGGPGGRGGPGTGEVTISTISGSSISLKTADGWTRTITVDSGTTYSKGSATIALGDLKVGDAIGFRETKETDGSYTIDAIAVILPQAGGQVTAIDGSTITVKDRDGTSVTITVTGSTTYDVAGATAKLSDIKVGMFLVAEGTQNTDGSLTATTVRAGDQGGPGGRGFGHAPYGGPGDNPNATAAPTATSAAG
ncbi:MAG TPA: DUF5666 domain-containing protein [Candidatus Limnocylindrales bacterium]|jgi:hypothetical protein